ncbi:hypothetical protein [Streptomyces xinghaiensis]
MTSANGRAPPRTGRKHRHGEAGITAHHRRRDTATVASATRNHGGTA